jgi:hypothetical protein
MEKSKEIDEVYTLSLRGLLSITISDPVELSNTLDHLELFLRRHYSQDGHPAIIFNLTENSFEFGSVNSPE